MSASLRRQVLVECAQLDRLIETHRPLLEKCVHTPPNAIELSALGAMLHAFYTGAENIFKRVAVEVDSAPPQGDAWHRGLLDRVAIPVEGRPAVISTDTRDLLRGYLGFRHVFRHAYTFNLSWEKMSELVLQCEHVLRRLEADFRQFLDRLQPP